MPQNTSVSDWIPWTGAALLVSLVHVIIDYHLGLYGPHGSAMTPLQAANAILTATAFAWWLILVGWAAQGNKTALLSNAIFILVWVCFWNGLIGLMVAPPPSAVFPYQDLAHVGGIVIGAGAALFTWRAYHGAPTQATWSTPLLTGALLILVCVIQSILGIRNA